MEEDELSVRDPLGHDIFLLRSVCPAELRSANPDIYDDFVRVIEKPALLIEVMADHNSELHYFRSVGWNQTVLIQVKRLHDRWESVHCISNPSNQELSKLLSQGKQLI